MIRFGLRALVVPPGCCLLLALLGALCWRWKPRLGRGLLVTAGLLLWCFSTPVIAGALLGSLQTTPALPIDGEIPAAQAIVVLSAGAERGREYGMLVPGRETLVRIRYGAYLQRRTDLPLLVTGGPPMPRAESLADAMKRVLEQDFGARVTWVERRARTTFENARGSAELLQGEDIKHILLVTNAWHMPRAQASFEAQGFSVLPAPTGFRDRAWQGPQSLIPRWSAIRDSAYAMHEWIGRVVYALAYL